MSVATEIERIQTAKETLKTKLNAKNDSEHQITNELISDYGNFVDSITGGANLDDYFSDSVTGEGTYNAPGYLSAIKKLKSPLTITGSSCFLMFAHASLEEIPIMNTSNVTNMISMFNSSNIKNLDLSNFDTSKVTAMNGMFNNVKVEIKGLNSFNTSNVTTMDSMFNSIQMATLDLSSFNTSKVTDMSSMFNNCNLLTTLDIRNFDFTNVTTYSAMFHGVPDNCKIIVKDDTAKEWITSKFANLTNVVTVAELGTE